MKCQLYFCGRKVSQYRALGPKVELRPKLLFVVFSCEEHHLGARLRGCTATQRSKKGSEKVLGRVLGEGSHKRSEAGGPAVAFTGGKGF